MAAGGKRAALVTGLAVLMVLGVPAVAISGPEPRGAAFSISPPAVTGKDSTPAVAYNDT